MKITDDESLAGAARDASPAGMASSPVDFDLLRRQLLRSVGRICPAWLAGHKEDIVQSALVRILETLKRNEQGWAPSPSYVWKVAYSATVDEIRRIRRKQDVSLDEESLENAGPASGSNPYGDQARRDLGEAIRGCLERLNEPRRLVVGIFLFGHGLAETEKLTGWEGKKVRNLLYRGLAGLRRCLSSKGIRP
jgi:RNA polymerase sigma-70 factor (ECF subfamily)